MQNLPGDPMILFSVLNTRLRDQYPSLRDLCEDMGLDESEIINKLKQAGFEYVPELNKFV